METLPLRMQRHSATTLTVVNWLAKRPEVARVIHPAHAQGRDAEIARQYLPHGMGGLLGFELHGGAQAGKRFIDALQLFYHVANIGDARSLAIHPASTTHSQLDDEDQMKSGVSLGYVRLSIGLEHPDDLLADLDRALSASSLKVAAE